MSDSLITKNIRSVKMCLLLNMWLNQVVAISEQAMFRDGKMFRDGSKFVPKWQIVPRWPLGVPRWQKCPEMANLDQIWAFKVE